MNQKIRKILFFIFSILFLGTTFFILPYSAGYRFDFRKMRFVGTGMIYLKASQRGITVYINGKPMKSGGYLMGAVKIEHLLPQKYYIEVKKPGFKTWKKEIEVEEKKATLIENLVLIRENISFQKSDISYENFFKLKENKESIPCNLFFIYLKTPPLFQDIETNCEGFQVAQKGFVIYQNKFYRINPEERTAQLIMENVRGKVYRNDRLVVFSENEIWFFAPEKENLIFRTLNKIEDITLFRKDYVIAKVGKEIKLIESNTKGGQNIYSLGTFEYGILATNEKGEVFVFTPQGIFASQILD